MIQVYIRTYILAYRHDDTVPYIMVGFLHGSFKPISEAWHLSQLMLLFMTQAAMELDSRGLLALLLLSLLLGSAKMVRWWKQMVMMDVFRAVEPHDFHV